MFQRQEGLKTWSRKSGFGGCGIGGGGPNMTNEPGMSFRINRKMAGCSLFPFAGRDGNSKLENGNLSVETGQSKIENPKSKIQTNCWQRTKDSSCKFS